jgi:hypothetical protein
VFIGKTLVNEKRHKYLTELDVSLARDVMDIETTTRWHQIANKVCMLGYHLATTIGTLARHSDTVGS